MHALIQNDQITQVGPRPRIWWDGDRWHDLREDDGTQAAALGWLPLTTEPRPDDTPTYTWDRTKPSLVDGLPVVGWTQRLWTEAELAAALEGDIAQQLQQDTAADLTKLRDAIDQLATLLGNNTTAGSIRSWKSPITNNDTLTGAQGKALADLLISEAQATRRIARQVLRLARSMVGDYSSSDVGSDM
jgi:hypothetical protein